MAQQFYSSRNLRFLLYEVLQAEELTEYDFYKDHSRETFDLVLDTVSKLASDTMYPVFQEMDSKPPVFDNGIANVHPAVRRFMAECGAGGWVSPTLPYSQGGQQAPTLLYFCMSFIMAAANYSMFAYLTLTTGAANLLAAFGSQELKDIYLNNMLEGKWQGTMALTEPNAGSSLADLTTQAEDAGKGYYKIKGQKIFITAGSTDATDNTVHMMLARIKGAPAGVKGISLFLVPKYRFGENGQMEPNDIVCTGIEHKLGYKGCPACQLTMGDENDCWGYLVGEPHKGLGYMFQMMNEERINVGIGAIAKATAAYYASAEYAEQRLQGRAFRDKSPETPQVAIIEHPDIQRMLLFQRAVAEGSLALALQVSKYLDLAQSGVDAENNEILADFLVPIVKTYPSEMGVQATSAAIQILGGYGYCKDFPVEQYYRDVRIDPIHEGTTGIQGQDLLGRKITMHKGKAYQLYKAELEKTIQTAGAVPELKRYADMLAEAAKTTERATETLLGYAKNDQPEVFLGDATLYLEMMGILTVGWQWLLQGTVANRALSANQPGSLFYQGKLYTMQYFFDYELPKIETLARVLTRDKTGFALAPKEVFTV